MGGNSSYCGSVERRTGEGKDRVPRNLAVKKDGGDVDALTGATISSRAYVNAVTTAYAAYLKKSGRSSKALDRIGGDLDAQTPAEMTSAETDGELSGETPGQPDGETSTNNEPEAQEGGQNE